MGHAERAVGESAAHSHYLDVGLVVANVVADLLEASKGGEIGDRIGEDDLSTERHPSGNARQVLLRDAGIEESIRKSASERFDHAEP